MDSGTGQGADNQQQWQQWQQAGQRVGVTIRGRRFGLPWVVGTVVLVLLCATIGCCNTITHGANGGGSSVAQATATHAAAAPKATKAPTATPKPLTRQEIAHKLVSDAISGSLAASSVKSWDVTSDDKAKAFVVTITLGEQLSTDLAHNTMQTLAYDILKGMYTSGKVSINDVDIAFRGPLVDQYGNASTGSYGYCDLTWPTAQKIVWENLAPSQAWDVYDDQGMR